MIIRRWIILALLSCLATPARAAAPDYIGCFKDEDRRALTGDYVNWGDFSRMGGPSQPAAKRCIAYCRERDFAYAARQAHGGCFCGDAGYDRYGPSDRCAPCSDDKSLTCGTDWTSAVYGTGIEVTPESIAAREAKRRAALDALATQNPCTAPALPADVAVVAVSIHGDGEAYPVSWVAGNASKRYRIRAEPPPDRPVVLAMTAYEPILWDIDPALAEHVVAAYVSGYYPPRVAGLPASVPVVRSALTASGRASPDREGGDAWMAACPALPAQYESLRDKPALEAEIWQIYGHGVDVWAETMPFALPSR